MADASIQSEHEALRNPGAILDGITGTYYIPVDETDGGTKENVRRVGVKAQEVEKYLPEAVSRDENNLMYVDYEALTVVLIEAYKEQKAEIELLCKVLEEHELLKPIPVWKGTDSLSIDYIKVYQLKKDCDTDVVIENTEQLVNYEGGHKRSIFIGSVENAIAAPDNLNLTLRASESITIDGAFELPRGAKLNIIVHGCH